MNIFYGECPACSYCWEVLNRLPFYCPECGHKLWNTTEEMIKGKEKVKGPKFP